MKLLVITPTIGSHELIDALISVEAQGFETLEDVEVKHVLLVDGEEYEEKVVNALNVVKGKESKVEHKIAVWPYNTGGKGFYGHKLYAAASMLVTPDIDWVVFLDEDNWFDPGHLESLVAAAMSKNADFSYSLRKFYTADGQFYADDNCSSLGPHKAWEEALGGHYLVDTSCYCFSAKFISKTGHLWNRGYAGDRMFFETVKDISVHVGTGKRTSCYRLKADVHPSAKEEREFIDRWNKYALDRYKGNYPWES